MTHLLNTPVRHLEPGPCQNIDAQTINGLYCYKTPLSGRRLAIVFWVLGCLWTLTGQGYAQDGLTIDNRSFRLMRAVMCETIEDYEPKFVAVAFSIDAGKISCYTSFDGVTETTYVSHKWYRRDELVTAKRLTIKPPSWATYSSIQLREADKGPWRVEVWDTQDQLIRTLRFSVTD